MADLTLRARLLPHAEREGHHAAAITRDSYLGIGSLLAGGLGASLLLAGGLGVSLGPAFPSGSALLAGGLAVLLLLAGGLGVSLASPGGIFPSGSGLALLFRGRSPFGNGLALGPRCWPFVLAPPL